MVGVVALLGVVVLWRFISGISWMFQPAAHPMYAQISKSRPLQNALLSIESEISDEASIQKWGSIWVMPSWIIKHLFMRKELIDLHNVIWIYPQTNEEKDGNQTYIVYINEKDGNSTCLEFKKVKQQEEFIQALVDKNFPIVVGYSAELKQYWEIEMTAKEFVDHCNQLLVTVRKGNSP